MKIPNIFFSTVGPCILPAKCCFQVNCRMIFLGGSLPHSVVNKGSALCHGFLSCCFPLEFRQLYCPVGSLQSSSKVSKVIYCVLSNLFTNPSSFCTTLRVHMELVQCHASMSLKSLPHNTSAPTFVQFLAHSDHICVEF